MDFLVNIFGWESLGFIAFMLVCCVSFHIWFNEKAVVYGPTILTTTGIFATFVGIALSLKSLNTDNIQESIPFLLNGLKTAFWASVFGVGFALTLKFRFYIFGVKSEGSDSECSSAENSKDLSEEILLSLKAIRDGISGDGSNNIVYQIRTLRDENNKKLDDLNETQKRSLEQIAQMGTETIIAALRDVIRDFNDKITEQFGENFKELNAAVGKLLEWQDKYRVHIETIVDRHDHIVFSMQKATDSYERLVSNGESFSRLATDLSQTLGHLEAQKSTLNQMMEELVRLVDTASGRIPEVEQRMIGIADQLASAIDRNQSTLNEEINKSINTLKIASDHLCKSVSDSQNSINESIARNTSLLSESVKSTTDNIGAINSSLNKSSEEMTERLVKQITVLDAALSEELTKSLESLGKQLAALSEKFVRDYEPLTERLREVVSLAKRLA